MFSGIGSSPLGIGLAIHLRDHFSRNAMAVTNSMNRLHRNANRVMRENLQTMRNVSLGVAFMGYQAIRAMGRWIDVGANFKYAMAGAKAVLRSTNAEFKALTKQAMRLGRETIYTSRQVASGMEYIARAGVGYKFIRDNMQHIIDLGTATQTRLGGKGGTADMVTNLMTSFNIAGNQIQDVVDIIVGATTKANIEFSDLHDSMKYAASDFVSLGIDFRRSAAMVAVMGNAGLKASIGGTSVGNMLRKLAVAITDFSTKRQTKGLHALGLSAEDMYDAKGNMKDIIDIMDIFRSKVIQGDPKTLAAITGITGIRGQRAFVALARELKIGKGFRELYEELLDVQGLASEIAKEMVNNIKGDMIILASAWENFKIAFTAALAPVLRPLLKILTSVLRVTIRFVETPFGKVFAIIAAGMVVVTTIAAGFLAIFSTIGLLLLSSQVSYRTMKSTAVWAWNSMAAAAARYALILRGMGGATSIGIGGAWTKQGARGFQKAPKVGFLRNMLGGLLTGIAQVMGFKSLGAGGFFGKLLAGFKGLFVRALSLLVANPYVSGAIAVFALLVATTRDLQTVFDLLKATLNLLLAPMMNSLKFWRDWVDKGLWTAGTNFVENWKKDLGGVGKALDESQERQFKKQQEHYTPAEMRAASPYEVMRKQGMAQYDLPSGTGNNNQGVSGQGGGKETKVTINIDGQKAWEEWLKEKDSETNVQMR